MRAIHIMLAGVAGIGFMVINVVMLVVHVGTTFLVFQGWGFWPALITFFTPPVSEIWWAISVWWHTGVFLNLFTLMICGVIALYLVQMVLAVLVAATEPQN